MGEIPRVRWISRAHFLLICAFLGGCALFAGRPSQEMSDTIAALRAASEVQADTLAPELMRQAKEWHLKAKHEYQLKNFKEAKEYAGKARYYAEQAEFESLKNGGNRVALPPDPSQNTN